MTLDLIRWSAPGPYEVVFSTRVGGVSKGPFASLNLGRKLGDVPERVDENRRRLCEEVGADVDRLTLNYQVHSAVVRQARTGTRGAPGDGLWTDEPGLPVLALSADCLPIALARANGGRPAVGVLHAGRIGVLAGIAEAGVAAVGPGRLAAAVGPGIGPCCYEVGEERPHTATASAPRSSAAATSTSGVPPSRRCAPRASSASGTSTSAPPATPSGSSRTGATASRAAARE